jgi:5-methylcytosine-specific restriction endonuclease McrA
VLKEAGEPQLRKASKYSRDDVATAVRDALCISDVQRSLGLAIHGNNYVTVQKLIAKYDLDISHFDVNSCFRRNKQAYAFDEIFCVDSLIQRPTLRKYVTKYNVIGDPKCVECGIEDEYNGKPITLQVDHINGINTDNRVENLRWLCPNCHSQTDTFGQKKRYSPI